MKSRVFILFVLLAAFSCESNNSKHCVKVKMVRQLCGQAIFEVLDSAYFDKGQSWEDGAGVKYEHVFSTILPCSFGNGLAEEDQVFYIQFTDTLTDNSCVRCYALLDGPEKFSHVIECQPNPGIE